MNKVIVSKNIKNRAKEIREIKKRMVDDCKRIDFLFSVSIKLLVIAFIVAFCIFIRNNVR